ncbi:acyltransferase [Thermopolyspora sp. NPDC052614]|uniref:acyltransferase family protein n=1 Tax=Thermopolyspora sp. NPDC052614 TaxID=3155682 RepID=UPI003447299C
MSLRFDRLFAGRGAFPGGKRPGGGTAPARPAANGGHARLGELDLLRFVAALSVVAFHYMAASKSLWGVQPTRIFPSVAPLTTLGILGVELFFIISGFVILMSVMGRTAGEFAISRFTRLFPAYWFSVVAIFLLYTFTNVQGFRPNLSPTDYVVNLTMAQQGLGVGHASGVYWSLWVELRFYVIMTVFALIGITVRRVLIFMAAWLVVAAYVGNQDPGLMDMIVIPHHAPYFVAGMAFYLIYRYGSSLITWALVGASYAFALREATERVAGRVKLVGVKDFPAPEWAVMLAITVIFLVVGLVAVHALSWMRWRGLVTLGALTYPLYLLHQTVSAVFIPAYEESLNGWLLVAITLGVSLALSHLIWRFVEKPAQRFLKPRLTASLRAARDLSAKVSEPPPKPGQTPQRGYIRTVSVPELLGHDGRGTV